MDAVLTQAGVPLQLLGPSTLPRVDGVWSTDPLTIPALKRGHTRSFLKPGILRQGAWGGHGCRFREMHQRDPNDSNKFRMSLLSIYAFHGLQADNWISTGLLGIKWDQNLGLMQGSHSFVQTYLHGKWPKIMNVQCSTDSFYSRKTAPRTIPGATWVQGGKHSQG